MSNTGAELDRLSKERVPPDRLMVAAYYFTHVPSDWDQRQRFRAGLRAAGFARVGTTEELTGDGCWHHYSHTVWRADPNVLRAADRTAAAVAAQHGVEYDSWEVVRDSQTGELKEASEADILKAREYDQHAERVERDAIARRATHRHLKNQEPFDT
jgi:hypothetical protein